MMGHIPGEDMAGVQGGGEVCCGVSGVEWEGAHTPGSRPQPLSTTGAARAGRNHHPQESAAIHWLPS